MLSIALREPADLRFALFAEDAPPAVLEVLLACAEEPGLQRCGGVQRDEEVQPEALLIPYAAEQPNQQLPSSGWWRAGALALALHGACWLFFAGWPVQAPVGPGTVMQVRMIQLPSPAPSPISAPPAPTLTPAPAEPATAATPPAVAPPPAVAQPKQAAVRINKPVEKPPLARQNRPPAVKAQPQIQSVTAPASTSQAPQTATTGSVQAPSTSQSSAALPQGNLQDSDIQPLRMDPPVYPRAALRRNLQGQVKVQFTITRDGRIADIQVLASSPPGVFDEAVREAMQKWRFQPRISGGQITARQASKVFFFKLDKR